MNTNAKLASGVKTQLNNNLAFSQTQAAWRFLNNEKVTLADLAEPLIKTGHELCSEESGEYVLIAHDWSHLSYGKHSSKEDTYNTIRRNVGYELQTSLILSAQHGGPITVAAMSLKDKNKINRSYSSQTHRNITHLEELANQIKWIESQSFSKKIVHVIDREADSAGFLRSIKDHLWLTRAHAGYKVNNGISSIKIQDLAQTLTYDNERTVDFKGKKATQLIAEVEISICRPSSVRSKKSDGSRVQPVPGGPICCRLIVSKIIDANRKELAMWYLISNVDSHTDKATIALWYYWRWSIESYFKLMKSAGMQLESWQQTSSMSIARRLLVAAMGCTCVWRMAHATGPNASEVRNVLIRLSGRQMKYGKEYTYPALLIGLWSMLAMDDMLNNFGVDKIKSLISEIFGDKGFV